MELTLQAMKTLSDLMDQALDLEGEARTRWLADLATGPHAALQPYVADMLARQSNMETAFLLGPVSGPVAPQVVGAPRDAFAAGMRVGPYVLEREIGQGGMGSVWLAVRDDGTLTRRVALKLPMLHQARSLAERFARERDILAQLTHPNIARLYDAGVADDGQPYLALEYIEGKAITEHCDGINLPVDERLRRFLQVAAAVQYAHANLVIHRDLKPGNILVSGDGQVHLLDFGIAKLLDDPTGQASESELTMIAGRALTLDYASPEQVNGHAISTASDVYSLGVVLYQLLTGQKPYQLKRGSRAELEEAILAGDAVPMSDAARRGDDASAARRGLSKDRLARALAGDLDTIVARAMKKDPQQRYATVAAFSEDIQRHLDGLPVEAQPDSWRYRAGKFVARNRVGVATSAVVFVALAAGFGTALWQADVATRFAQWAEIEAQTARAEKARADAEAVAARRESERADAQAQVAVAAATRADQEAELARREASRADRESLTAKREAARADEEAKVARRETTRGNAVQGYLVDLFSANSNDQKNAVEVRSLNAKQLLDRGARKLEDSGGEPGEIDATLFRLFGNLYENLNEYEASKRLHERSVAAAEKLYGKQSKQYAMAILDLAWVEGYGQLGKRLDLIVQSQAILRKVAPDSEELAQALYVEAENVDQSNPARAATAAAEALQILSRKPGALKLKATAERSLGHAQRALGNFELALAAYRRSVDYFTQLSGADNDEVGETMGGVSACLRQLLRLPEAEVAARKTLEILRPYDRELADAKVFGRALAMLMTDQGQAGDATTMMQAAYDRLKDVDGKPHSLRSAVTQTLANIALARGDAQTALRLAQRSRTELRSRTHSVQASVLTLIARAAIEAGELKVAREAVAEARKINSERGLPALSARALAQVAAELAALTGDRSGAEAEYAQLAQRFPVDHASQSAPFARLLVDNSRARVASSLRQWEEVMRLLSPWLTPATVATLPAGVRSDAMLLAAEAAVHLRLPEATWLLDDASRTIAASDVPASPRLARLRVLQEQLRASS